jgi:hypothetical protein
MHCCNYDEKIDAAASVSTICGKYRRTALLAGSRRYIN